MATQLQIRRGTSTQVAAFTGAEGEIVVNTTNDSVHVNDGSTAGGFELARADFNNISASATLTIGTLNTTNLDLTNLEVTNIKAKDGTAAGSIADSTGVVTLISSSLTTADITTLKIGGTTVTATAAELNYVDGVTSAIQTQIDAKAPIANPTFTGSFTSPGIDDNASSTAVTIDSSGNLLVGTSDAVNVATNLHDGVTIYSDGRTDISRSGGQPINLRRRGSDGTLAAFFKEASGSITNVGSIGTLDSNSIYIGNGEVNLRMIGVTNDIRPATSSGTNRDAAVDLGDSNARFKDLYLSGTANVGNQVKFNAHSGYDERTIGLDSTGLYVYNATDSRYDLSIDQSGNVGIGTDSPNTGLSVVTGSANGIELGQDSDASTDSARLFFSTSAGSNAIHSTSGAMRFFTGSTAGSSTGTERMRIDSSGNLLVGTTDTTLFNNTSGGGINLMAANRLDVARAGDVVSTFNRMTDDGSIIQFYAQGALEGSIDVSGNIVSLVGFSGAHASSGIDVTTAKGTVVSTIDQEHKNSHAKIKVSDSEGDARVYGVVDRISEEGDIIVSGVGIGEVKVTGACAGGDLLESNGDGTAKVQSDDIIRSKTIGKVTIGNGDEGVKLVSCVLYCG